jgi:hypothetical protein
MNVEIKTTADRVSDMFTVAYFSEDETVAQKVHLKSAMKALDELAALLGFQLVPIGLKLALPTEELK